jgi:hypothetical protein
MDSRLPVAVCILRLWERKGQTGSVRIAETVEAGENSHWQKLSFAKLGLLAANTDERQKDLHCRSPQVSRDYEIEPADSKRNKKIVGH